MTVGEMIKMLEGYPSNANVIFEDNDGIIDIWIEERTEGLN